mgnify:FL=1
MNGCIWDQQKGNSIRQVHRGEIDLAHLKHEIVCNLQAQIPLMNTGIDMLLKLQNFKNEGVPMSKIIAQVTSDFKVPKKQAHGVLKAFAVEKSEVDNLANSAFGVANAFTRYGQTLNDENWVKFDQIGGKVANISESRWSATVKRAASLNEKELEKVFGYVAA